MKLRFAAFAALIASPVFALDDPQTKLVDPYRSGNWDCHQIEILGDPKVISFDERVKVSAPAFAEDSFHVPVLVDASALTDVAQIVVFVDYGPVPKILTYRPGEATAKIAFRFKIDQSTPVRAAVQTRDGAWHVGSTTIDAAGGGCTMPAVAYASNDWEEKLGEVHGQIWPETGRLRMVVDHPMDTGLADGIPIFIIEDLNVSTMEGEALASLELYEPVNEDPAFTLYFDQNALGEQVRVTGRDNNGNPIEAILEARPLIQ